MVNDFHRFARFDRFDIRVFIPVSLSDLPPACHF